MKDKLHILLNCIPDSPFKSLLALEVVTLQDYTRAVISERDRLRNSLHTCGPTCSKAGCVNSRMQVVMRQALHALENHGGNYKLTDAGCVVHDAAIAAIEEVLK